MITPLSIGQSFIATVLIITGVLGFRLLGILLLNRNNLDEEGD